MGGRDRRIPGFKGLQRETPSQGDGWMDGWMEGWMNGTCLFPQNEGDQNHEAEY